jgi:D-lactate dehydrogenase (cytochrome)
VTVAQSIREHHSHGEDYFTAQLPDAVCFAKTTEEVSEIIKICAASKIPVIPYGTGTSVEGHVTAPFGGISIDLSQMDKVLEVHAEDMDVRVQAGVTRKALNEYLKDTGLFFPVDPGADASLGGMAATRASGTNAVRYGTMRELVMGLTVVTADGRIIRTGGRARKSSAGYDLTRLFVGSEGTLGVITEVHLRLFGIPEKISAAICQYPTMEAAVDTVIMAIQSGIPVARVELLDEMMMDATISYSKLEGYEAKPTLFFEFHGTEASVVEQAEMVGAISDEFGGSAFEWTQAQEERNRLWQARHDAYYACLAMEPGKRGLTTDVCVPISMLPECIAKCQQVIEEAGFRSPVLGHIGDGNFHMICLIDLDQPEDLARAKAASDRVTSIAVSMGGTCTGEHGIGIGKVGFLEREHGEGVELMRSIKMALDPKGIMNPGKVLDMGN